MINNKHGNTHLKKKQTTKKYTMKKISIRRILSLKFKIYKSDTIVLYFLPLHTLATVHFDWKVKLIPLKKYKFFYVFRKARWIKFM